MKRFKLLALMSASVLIVSVSVLFAGTFPAGYCTSGVAQIKGGIPWAGNAYQWYANAKNAGIPVGTQAKVGAIVVFPGNAVSSVGHVGVVTSLVNGQPVMKSMNDVDGFNKWTTRPVANYASSKVKVTPTGYIYYKLELY